MEPGMISEMKLFTGNANPSLAEAIASFLDTPMGSGSVGRFSDGEINVEITDNVRGRDVFLIQSTCAPTNDHLMELLILADACKRASAGRITAVIPYYGYARQDRKVAPRAPITAKLVADLLIAAGMDRILTMELHAGQIQGFFNTPVDNLYSSSLLCEYALQRFNWKDIVVVSPDAGGVERARAFSRRLHAGLAIIDKRRSGPNVSEVMHIVGEVAGKTAVLVDDMIDTAGTLCAGAAALKEYGARRVVAYCVHPVLSGPAIDNINNSTLDEIVVTDTIPLQPEAVECPKIRQLSVAQMLAETIRRMAEGESVSSLYVD